MAAQRRLGHHKSAEESPKEVWGFRETARGNGFLDTFDSVASAERAVGKLILNKLGMGEKTRDDGTVKRRFIWDLRESEVNRAVYLGERVVLPRLEDAADNLRDLQRLSAPGDQLRMLVLDISDAFHQVPLHPEERRLHAALVGGVPVVYRCLVFGS